MAKRVGVGVIGLDHWYTSFGVIEEAAKSSRTRLVAIADKSNKRLSEVARKHKADLVTTDFGKVLADPDVDLVCSLVNTRDSVAVTRRALQAGKHVACVKPMAMTLRQADALIELAERNKRVLWCFDQLGRLGVNPQLKSLLKRGGIGVPLTYYSVMQAGLPKSWPTSTDPGWWIDPKLAPFGAWADHAIYTIDMLRHLFDADVVSVQGEMANRRYPKLRLEDWGLATLRFDTGLVAVVEDSWTAEGYWPHWSKIVGSKGAVHMDPVAFKDPIVVATPKGLKPLKSARRRGGMLAGLVKLITDGAARPSPARESRRNLAIAFAAYKSAKTGKAVPL